MKEQLINFETAKLAKEKGVKLDINGLYWEDGSYDSGENALVYEEFQDVMSAPTQSLLQKWLRDVHKISVCVDFRHSETNKIEGINSVYYDVNIYTLSQGDAFKTIKLSQINDSYEEALEIGLQEALKLIK